MPFLKDPSEESSLESIAIVGMACRLPGQIDSPSKFWETIREQKSVRTPKVPCTRFNIDAFYHPDLARPGSFNSMGGYFLDGNPEDFDPSFFGITPVEAMWMDPQQKKMLEVCYECLESAGLSLEDVAGTNTGVFVGTFTNDYQQMTMTEPDFRHSYAATGVDVGIMSNRIGNVFDLNGPSFTINTACSSSIYAIHNACNALRARDCEAVVTGGVNLILTVDQHINTAKLGVLSPTSTCHTFDQSADGYGRAEGAGALYLKRLSDAIRDSDVIRGVIRSSAVNTNGKVDGMGITYPSVRGQERVIRSAYQRANIDPNETAYFECHGTGTSVGDPIEVRAVANAMNDRRSLEKPLLLGGVKANIGHSEAASGIFAVMKAALLTEKALIPGVCGFKTLNSQIKDKDWNVKVTEKLMPFPEDFEVRRASVSSFGYGGTNGHVIIEAIDSICPRYKHGQPKATATYSYDTSRPFLIGMSAHSVESLRRNIIAHQTIAEEYHLPDLAYTLNSRRARFAKRAFTVATAGREKTAFNVKQMRYGTKFDDPVKIGYVFTGQGAQWPRMGYEAMQTFPVFAETIRALDNVLWMITPRPSWTLEETLQMPAELSRVGEAEISQPVCTAVQIAIVDLFSSWGIEPEVTVGHSSGEIGAAYAAGRLSAREAILAAFFRGLAVTKAAPMGTMLAVGDGAAAVESFIPEEWRTEVTIACENSPSSVTLSGTMEGIDAVKEKCVEAGMFARELRTGKAYHSYQMNPVAPLYAELYAKAEKIFSHSGRPQRRPLCPMMSSVTGKEITEPDLSIDYWCDNLRLGVRFDSALTALGRDPKFADVTTLIEIGPHSALGGPVKQICAANSFSHLGYSPSLIRKADSAVALLETAGRLFAQGLEVDFAAINAIPSKTTLKRSKQSCYIPDLPPYQWSYGRKYWYEPRAVKQKREEVHMRHDILGRRMHGISDHVAIWKNMVRQRDIPWLKDHTLGDSVIFPAAAHISLAGEALLQLLNIDIGDMTGVTFRNIDIRKALIIPEAEDGIEVHTRLHKPTEVKGTREWFSFVVESVDEGVWTVHTEGKISVQLHDRADQYEFQWPYEESQLHQKSHKWYDAFHRVGFNYGTSFQTMSMVKFNGKDRAAASGMKVQTSSGLMTQESRYILHPSTIDGVLHLVIASINKGLHKKILHGVVPLTIEEVTIHAPGCDDGKMGDAVAWTSKVENRYSTCHAQLKGESGKLVMDIKNVVAVDYDAVLFHTTSKVQREPFGAVSWEHFTINNDTSSWKNLLELNTVIVSLHDGDATSSSLAAAFDGIPQVVSLDAFDVASSDYIIINDMSEGILASPSEQAFEKIKQIMCSAKPIVWLTRGVNEGKTLAGGMAEGFLRALRSEFVSSQLFLLDMDEATDFKKSSQIVSYLLSKSSVKDVAEDFQYWLKSTGGLFVPRITPNEQLNSSFFGEQESTLTTLEETMDYRGTIRDAEVVFEATEVNTTVLAAHEIEVQVLQSELLDGDLRSPTSKPRIVIGKVVQVGSECTSYFDQEVAAYSSDVFQSRIRTSVFSTVAPGQASTLAAVLPVLCKAVAAVAQGAKFRNGDRLLVLSPTSRLTETIIVLGRLLKLEIGHASTASDLAQAFAASKPPKVAIATSDCSVLAEAWRLMPPQTNFVLHEAVLEGPLDMSPLTRGVSLITSDIATMYENDTDALSSVLDLSLEILERSENAFDFLAHQIDVSDLSNLARGKGTLSKTRPNILAFEYGLSKVKVSSSRIDEESSLISQCQKSIDGLRFDSESAYLLSGCLGGLGRSLTSWMLEHGCKNFVFLSRSGSSKPEAATLITNLFNAGASTMVYSVDAGDEEAVASIVKEVQLRRPIKGVIHAAMVLQDGMFETMTHERYMKAVNPKLKGAWSLHKALGTTPLDFFAMTSSISSVLGNPGQANYCAGNSYLDALARYRRTRGLAATSIALPMVLDIGVVAENANIETSLARKGLYGISEKEMLEAFEAGLLPDMNETQLILGLEPTQLATAMIAAERTDAFWFHDARLSAVRAAVESQVLDAAQTKPRAGFLASLSDLEDEQGIINAVAQHIGAQIARILMLPADGIQMEGKSILSHGLDSMIGSELRSWLFTELGVEVGFQSLLSPKMTVNKLARHVWESTIKA